MGSAAQQLANASEADWDAKATLSAIAAARSVISGDGINARAMISSLSDIEWGWIVAAVIFGWIDTKAQQATAEGISSDVTIRTMTARDPAPWETGAIATILPALGGLQNVDWSKPVGEWSKDQIVAFAWQIYRLTDGALAARDDGATDKIVRRLGKNQMEREMSAHAGGSLMGRHELDDEIPF